MNLDSLNVNQKKAVLHNEGPCLVVAGAGSGKTKVLTTRIAYLVENYVDSSEILAITFTNKAAKEMRVRLSNIIGYNYAFVGTFHSFGVKIVRENYEELNLMKNFTIIDSDDVGSIIKKIMKDLLIDSKEISVNYIKNKISYIKNQMLSESGIDREFTNFIDKKVVTIYRRYVDILSKNNAIDFDDLLMLPVRLFEENPSTLLKYQEKFKYILVDEYQDTNEVQYKLVKMLSAKHKNIFVVGDVNQSIYSFRWSNYKNIMNFEKDFSNVSVITLDQNYRSTTNILKAANDVIKNNTETKDVDLFSELGDGQLIKYYKSSNDKDENTYVASEIKKLLEKGYSKRDFAIFYRTNAQSRGIEEAMIKGNIPYRVVGSFLFYKRKEIKDLIAYLKLISNSYDDISLERIINVPKRGIGNSTVEKIRNVANENHTCLYDAISSGKEYAFKELIQYIKDTRADLDLTELIDLVLEKSGIIDELKAEKTLDADLRIENLMEFRSITENYQKETGSANLEDFLEEISLVADLTEHKEDSDLVTLMTIHAAKGLEFKVVFLIGLEEGILPHVNSLNSKMELEEERRLCYVAITRAKEKLYISSSDRRMLYGKIEDHKTSRFIDEINKNLLDISTDKKVNTITSNPTRANIYSSSSSTSSSYSEGDVVMHIMFGKGVVTAIDEKFVTCAFDKRFGIKKVLINYKGLKKR
ncbi:MAG: 3'-5' exonuclease [bacterium]